MSMNFDNQMGLYKDICYNLGLSDGARIKIKKIESNSIKRTNVGNRIIRFNIIIVLTLILLAPLTIFAGYHATQEVITWIEGRFILIETPDRQLSGEQISAETNELLNLVLASPDILSLSGRYDNISGNTLSDRYEAFYSGFNGIREFEKRPDAASALLAKLEKIVEAGSIDGFYPNGESVLLLLSLERYNTKLSQDELVKYEQILESDLVLQFYVDSGLIPQTEH